MLMGKRAIKTVKSVVPLTHSRVHNLIKGKRYAFNRIEYFSYRHKVKREGFFLLVFNLTNSRFYEINKFGRFFSYSFKWFQNKSLWCVGTSAKLWPGKISYLICIKPEAKSRAQWVFFYAFFSNVYFFIPLFLLHSSSASLSSFASDLESTLLFADNW